MHLIDNVLPHAPYRQFVVTVPPALRYWMGTSRKLARAIHRIAVSEIDRYYKKKAMEVYGVLGDPGDSFTIHAATAVHESDRKKLEQLIRYIRHRSCPPKISLNSYLWNRPMSPATTRSVVGVLAPCV